MNGRPYHAQRALDEWQRSLAATEVKVAEAHRELSLMHLQQLMANTDPDSRQEAEQILIMIGGKAGGPGGTEPAQPAPARRGRRKRGLGVG